MSSHTGKEIAIAAAQAMEDKKAEDVLVLEMSAVMVDAEYFVIGSCVSFPQLRAVSLAVSDKLVEYEVELRNREGRNNNSWLLLDYGNVIVHIFLSEKREYYNLEKLWADAKRIPHDQ